MNTPKTEKVSQKRARVTTISVSRLFNTGNYTNARYDLTVEIPKGVSANKTIHEMAAILASLAPVRKPSSLSSLENARVTPWKDLSDYQKSGIPEWEKEEKAYHERLDRRERMLAALDDLGVQETLTDAKTKWDDSDDRDVPY